jgi:predicted nucleotidyltransferase
MMRQEAIRLLKELMQNNSNYLAAWEGGSAATGYLDENSDLDLGIIVKDDYVEESVSELKAFIEKIWGIDFFIRVPEPNWHGHSQFFCKPKSEFDFFYFDILIEKETCTKDRFTSSDRHGQSIIWFDHNRIIDTNPLPKDTFSEQYKRIQTQMSESFPLLSLELKKNLFRRKKIESFESYFGFLRRYVALLNIKYRPAKYDFGLRYIDRDFPTDMANQIENLLYVKDFEKLKENALTVLHLFKELL